MSRCRIATWADELGAVTESERYLAEAAAKASWRIDRCRGAEAAALSRQLLKAGEDYDDALAEEVERLGERLCEDPAGVVRQLRRSTAGCRWLIGQWETLAERLAHWKALEPTERHLATHLMGKHRGDLFDPAVSRLVAAYLGALRIDAERACQILGNDRPEEMSAVEFDRRVKSLCETLPDSAGGQAAQKAIVAEAIAELSERLELIEAREGRDRELRVRERLTRVRRLVFLECRLQLLRARRGFVPGGPKESRRPTLGKEYLETTQGLLDTLDKLSGVLAAEVNHKDATIDQLLGLM